MLKRGIEFANDARVATLPSLTIFRTFGRHRCERNEASARTMGCVEHLLIAAPRAHEDDGSLHALPLQEDESAVRIVEMNVRVEEGNPFAWLRRMHSYRGPQTHCDIQARRNTHGNSVKDSLVISRCRRPARSRCVERSAGSTDVRPLGREGYSRLGVVLLLARSPTASSSTSDALDVAPRQIVKRHARLCSRGRIQLAALGNASRLRHRVRRREPSEVRGDRILRMPGQWRLLPQGRDRASAGRGSRRTRANLTKCERSERP